MINFIVLPCPVLSFLIQTSDLLLFVGDSDKAAGGVNPSRGHSVAAFVLPTAALYYPPALGPFYPNYQNLPPVSPQVPPLGPPPGSPPGPPLEQSLPPSYQQSVKAASAPNQGKLLTFLDIILLCTDQLIAAM